MTTNTIPPQAYTKETLSEAFEWLTSQPQEMKGTVQSTDTLVSLYLRAKRHGQLNAQGIQNSTKKAAAADNPVSIQHFKSDLKDLAEGLKQFEPEPQATVQAQHQVAPQVHYPATHQPEPKSGQQVQPQAPAQPAIPQVMQKHSPAPGTTYTERVVEVKQPQLTDDPRVLQLIRWTQQRFNLSSESEAARLLITIGYEHVAQSFPKSDI